LKLPDAYNIYEWELGKAGQSRKEAKRKPTSSATFANEIR
jgi:hypothetical protein